ncbi:MULTISPECIES: hypothetical protein [Acinetobacter]|uniref:hypothetical protein n=1 Tax=Acinetobacter TaxID=469 RepID=UPI00131504B1|nr:MULTISPECIES: hypothetical protein [Acinetobacter]MDH2508167.1 hypothetical protein [Acinetobacter baumannii]HCQ9557197.1 hypothetical protein [Acinetobacter baumannii]HEN9570763.1 hypothetical protein [Acinetobacter baumannii]HEN9600991.1 hypothetical protein [Acinetobacter baumannii]
MTALQITEAQFISLVGQASKDESIELDSLNVFECDAGILIQSAAGEYLLIVK